MKFSNTALQIQQCNRNAQWNNLRLLHGTAIPMCTCMTVHTYTHPHTHKGELIDRIEHNVENTAEYVERGKKQIRTAAHYKKRRRVSIAAVIRAHENGWPE